MSIAVFGDANVDVVLGELPRLPATGVDLFSETYRVDVGGSAAITAHGLSAIGAKTFLHAPITDDLFGRFLTERLLATGVLLRPVIATSRSDAGISVAFSHAGDRGFLSVPCPPGKWLETKLAEDVRHVHVCSHPHHESLRSSLFQLSPSWRQSGRTLSLDPAGPPPGHPDPQSFLRDVAPVDILFVNEAESKAFSGLEGVAGAKTLLQYSRTVVLKRGSHGAVVVEPLASTEILSSPAQAIETTGAGDSFAAGALALWMNGLPLAVACRFGAVCGARSTEHLGGVAAHYTFSELARRFLQSGRK